MWYPEMSTGVELCVCRDCQGSGWNGSLGGYALVCRPCGGQGRIARAWAHIVHRAPDEEGRTGDVHED